MPSMRQAQGPAHWTGNPPLSQLWLGSALGALAMLVLHAVCFLKMVFSRKARECHAEPAPQVLPDGRDGTPHKEISTAAAAIDSASRHHARRPHAEDEVGTSRARGLEARARAYGSLHESCSGSTRASLKPHAPTSHVNENAAPVGAASSVKLCQLPQQR